LVVFSQTKLLGVGGRHKKTPYLFVKLGANCCSFYINLPVGGISAALIFFFFQTPAQAKTVPATRKEKFLQMDPVGLSLIMCGIVSFILALEYGGQTKPWNSSVVIGLLVGAVLIWTVFAFWEIFQGDRAMLMPRLLRKRSVWQPSVFQFFFAASYFVLLYYLPIYFQSVDNASPIRSGVLNLPLVIALAIGSTVSGMVVSKTGHAAPFMLGGAVLATVSAGLMYTFDIGTSMGKWIGYQFFYGAAAGLGFQMAINIAQASAEPADVSSVTATVFCKFHRRDDCHISTENARKLTFVYSFPNHRWCLFRLRRTVWLCEPPPEHSAF
jgi:hypothetical protein